MSYKINNKFLVFSCILLMFISIGAFMAYIFSARQINISYVEQQLAVAGESIELQLEREISGELLLITKLGHSPIIRQFLMNPEDPVLRMYAMAELDLFQQYSTEGLVFWISDADKMFYATGTEPFLFDPDNSENYWYNMTLYETDDYNFNINYNNDLEVINLWINVPVFSITNDGTPVGMLGTGLNLTKITQVVDTAHRERSADITAYLFNRFQEITSASDFDLILNKILLADHLGDAGAEAIQVIASIEDGRGQNYIYGDYMYRVGIISAIKDWNMVLSYPLPGILSLNQPMNVVFFGMLFLILLLFIIMNIFVARADHTMSEQNLRLIDANDKLNLVVRAAKIGLWDMEIVHNDMTNPANAFNWSNEFRYMLGFNDETDFPNVLGSWIDRLHPDDVERTIDHAVKHILDKTGSVPYEIEYRLKKKDGEYAYFRAYGGTFRDEEGNAIRIVGSLVDITRAKNMLLDVEKQRVEAEIANKAKSDFLARMSHEIRTPMNAIVGITQIQLQKEDLPSEYSMALEKIYSSSKDLLGIINDILDLSKIESGKMEINHVEYEIPSLIHDTVQLNIVRIGSKAIEFILDIDDNLPSRLIGDELRIKQILNNLLSNAVKYTQKGHVKLSVKKSAYDADSGHVVLCFVIEDTGQGMKSEDADKLFSEYTRFNIEANRATEGTGIGLNITKNLVDLMEGTISVKSEYGKGSIFTVTVKQQILDSEVIGAELAQSISNFAFSNIKRHTGLQILCEAMPYGKVLIVDDVETNLYVAEGLMLPYALQIDTATSGYAAIEKVESGRVYDIIFMDHMMPYMDGIETTQKLRSMDYKGTIVALTANALAGNDMMFKQSGFDDFISKPIDLRQLDAILNRHVRDKNNANREAANRGKNSKLHEIFIKDAEKAVITLKQIAACKDESEIKLFTTTVHAMKSALSIVGEEEASKAALRLEEAGHKGEREYIAANTEHFILSLEVLMKKLSSGTAINEEGLDFEEERDYLKEQLEFIIFSCESYDDAAVYASLDLLEGKQWKKQTMVLLKTIRDKLYLHSDFDGAAKHAALFLEGNLT